MADLQKGDRVLWYPRWQARERSGWPSSVPAEIVRVTQTRATLRCLKGVFIAIPTIVIVPLKHLERVGR